MPTETEEKKNNINNQQFLDSLRETLYGDDEKKDIHFYAFLYNPDQYIFTDWLKGMDVQSVERERRTSKKDGMQLDNDLIEAARQGCLFIVSDKMPYLQKVSVDENGRAVLEKVVENPLPERNDLTGKEKRQWDTLRDQFADLARGNISEGLWSLPRWWAQRNARKAAETIGQRVRDARQRETEETSEALDARQKQIKEEEKQRKEEAERRKTEAERRKKEEKKRKENESKKIQKEASAIAKEMKTLSEQFNRSRYMDDNAMKAGTELRLRFKRLEKSGNVELLSKLEKMPEFKANLKVYQGQANLEEMVRNGRRARRKLEATPNNQQVERDTVLDIMALEYADNLKVRMAQGEDVSQELEYIGRWPNANHFTNELKEAIGQTASMTELMRSDTQGLKNMFGNEITSRHIFTDIFKKLNEKVVEQEAPKKEDEKVVEQEAPKKEDEKVVEQEAPKKEDEKVVEQEAPKKEEEKNAKEQEPVGFEKAWDLVKQGNHKEAAGIIAQEMKNLSGQFDQSKYMDENAIRSGMELREQLNRLLEKGDVELLSKLEEMPEFKANLNVYQGQANLAEMGQKGIEARKKLAETPDDQQVEANTVFDIMASEYASNLKIRMAQGKDVSEELEHIGSLPNPERIANDIKETIGKTQTMGNLLEGNTQKLKTVLGQGLTSQQMFKEAFKEAGENAKKEQEAKKKELQKDAKKEEMNKDNQNKKQAPQRGGK